jgi:hypothetical protein
MFMPKLASMEGARPSGHVRSSFHMHMALEHTVMVGLRRCIELIEAVRFLTPICELRSILQHHAFVRCIAGKGQWTHHL